MIKFMNSKIDERKVLGLIQRGQYKKIGNLLIAVGEPQIILCVPQLEKLFESDAAKAMKDEEADFEQFVSALNRYSGNVLDKLLSYKEEHTVLGSELGEVYIKLYFEDAGEGSNPTSVASGRKHILFEGTDYDNSKEAISFGSFDYTFLYYIHDLGSQVMYVYPEKDAEYLVKDDYEREIIGTKFRFEKKGSLENPELIKDILNKMSDEGRAFFLDRNKLGSQNNIVHTENGMDIDTRSGKRNYDNAKTALQEYEIKFNTEKQLY